MNPSQRIRVPPRLALDLAQDAPDGSHDLPPFAGFGDELFTSSGCEFVELCLAIVLACAPIRRHPAAIFETMQRRIERTLLDLKHLIGSVLDNVRDSVTVSWPGNQRAQDQHVERPLQHFVLLLLIRAWHEISFHSNVYGNQILLHSNVYGKGQL